MEIFKGLFVGLGFSILLVSLYTYLVGYRVHKSMTVSSCSEWGYGNFQQFIEQFSRHKWDNKGWPSSLFDNGTNSKLHASIVCFDGKGMVLRGFDYLKYVRFMWSVVNKSNRYKKDLWS